MIRGENFDSLPNDLVIEILLRLPTKSIARFRSVSKPWGSMLGSPYFTDLFLTMSSARPRLLFAVEQGKDWCFWTSPQPHNPYEKSSSLGVTADLHMNFVGGDMGQFCGYAPGLVCLPRNLVGDTGIKICNPSTGQFANLPFPKGDVASWTPLLGYDPIDKQGKVLCVPHSEKEEPYQILTLGTGNKWWRKIHCPLKHDLLNLEIICINGALYYFAEQMDGMSMIVCFDFKYETFKFIYRDFFRDSGSPIHSKLINYKGQLGVISLKFYYTPRRLYALDLCMWVLKDVEKPKPEWSEYIHTFWTNEDVDGDYYAFLENEIVSVNVNVVGVTASGDFVLSNNCYTYPFYVFYFNPERNTLQRVEIQGFGPFKGRSSRVKIFVDHIEDLKVVKTTYAETSISPPKTEA